MSRRHLLTGTITLITLILIGFILTDGLPILRGPAPETSEWYWPYQLRPSSRWWAPIVAALGFLGISVWWTKGTETERWRTAVGIIGLVMGNILLQLALIYADRPEVGAELIDRTLSNLASGFFEPAAEIVDLNATLRSYPEAMPSFISEHARTHPPGLIIANRLMVQALAAFPNFSSAAARHVWPLRCTDLWLLDRPANVAAALAVWSLIPLLAGAMTVVPAYGLARRFLRPNLVRAATTVVATMPAILLFAPKTVQLYAPLTLTSLLALQLGLERRTWRWFLLSGLLLSVNTFLSLGNAALVLLFTLYFLFYVWHHGSKNDRFSNWLPRFGMFILGTASIWLVYWVGWGVTPWSISQTGLQQHYELVTSGRRYEWWVAFNLLDLFIYAGLPVMIGFLMTVRGSLQSVRHGQMSPIKTLALALFIFILILDVSGSARGEVGRLWMFFMPLLAIVSVDILGESPSNQQKTSLIIGLQLAMTVSLGIAWKPVRAVIVVAERPSMPEQNSPEFTLDIAFSELEQKPGMIYLIGYDLDTGQDGSGDSLDLTLYWHSTGPILRPYTVFTHVVNADGKLVAQQDNWPVNGLWPPTCWSQGEIVVDPYQIKLPADLDQGEYTLGIGIYDARDGSRLLTTDGRDIVVLPDRISR